MGKPPNMSIMFDSVKCKASRMSLSYIVIYGSNQEDISGILIESILENS